MNNDINILTRSHFPINLNNIKSPPKQLFIRGTLPTLHNHKFLCVVGSRYPSTYGKEACKKLLSGLKGYPISIVSGLAIGIDSHSHKVALDVGLNCIGFPGSPLEWDMIHPKSSIPLAKEIVDKGGSILSEYGQDFIYADWAFPSRNRLMAGISHATLVIEAKKGSGSLMTAKYAEDFGRDLLTVPGSIFSDMTYGPHMLLKSCANPVTCSEDILSILGFNVVAMDIEDQLSFRDLDDISKQIVREIAKSEITIDMLCHVLHLGIGDVNERISKLELDGLIRSKNEILYVA